MHRRLDTISCAHDDNDSYVHLNLYHFLCTNSNPDPHTHEQSAALSNRQSNHHIVKQPALYPNGHGQPFSHWSIYVHCISQRHKPSHCQPDIHL